MLERQADAVDSRVPATVAYDIACGTAMTPTVSPATTSRRKSLLKLYDGIHCVHGKVRLRNLPTPIHPRKVNRVCTQGGAFSKELQRPLHRTSTYAPKIVPILPRTLPSPPTPRPPRLPCVLANPTGGRLRPDDFTLLHLLRLRRKQALLHRHHLHRAVHRRRHRRLLAPPATAELRAIPWSATFRRILSAEPRWPSPLFRHHPRLRIL